MGLKRFAAAIAFVLLTGCSSYELQENLSYDKNNVPFGVFDVYTPKGSAGAAFKGAGLPAIVAIHGGAWEGGDKSGMHKFADVACAHGYVVLAPNYRLSLDGPNWKGSKWPAQIDDLQTALRWFRDNHGVIGVDPDRIGAFGISAGGHLSTMLALRDDPKANDAQKGRVVCTFEVSGEHDMTLVPPENIMFDAVAIMTAVFGHGSPWSIAELEDISTIKFARPDASIVICHSINDSNVFIVNAYALNDALKAKNADVTIFTKTGDHHGDAWNFFEPQMIEFFDKHLK